MSNSKPFAKSVMVVAVAKFVDAKDASQRYLEILDEYLLPLKGTVASAT